MAWSSDSNLWGNQLLKNWVLNRTKVWHSPRTQTYRETNYLNIKFWTEPSWCLCTRWNRSRHEFNTLWGRAGVLVFWNRVLNVSYVQPCIHVTIISSEIINSSKYRRGQLTSNQKEKGRKEFHICGQQVQITNRLQSFVNKKNKKIKKKLVNH